MPRSRSHKAWRKIGNLSFCMKGNVYANVALVDKDKVLCQTCLSVTIKKSSVFSLALRFRKLPQNLFVAFSLAS